MRISKRIILFISVIFISKQSFGQFTNDRRYWLMNNTINLENHLPSFPDSSFAFLDSLLANKRIVFLGETVHFDHETEKYKLKMIEYLHKHLGFEVFLEERGFIQSTLNNIEINNITEAKWHYATLAGWSGLAPHEIYLVEYLCNNLNEGDTLHHFGFDIFLNSNRKLLIDYLENKLVNYSSSIVEDQKWQSIKKYLLEKNKSILRNHYPLFFNNIRWLLSEINAEGNRLDSTLIQQLKSIRGYFEHIALDPSNSKLKNKDWGKSFDSFKYRDMQMADNLLWFIEKVFPNKKIIVSASSYHTARNVEELKKKNRFFDSATPIGHYVWEKHKDEIYSIAFVFSEGEYGMFGGYVEKMLEIKNGKLRRAKPKEYLVKYKKAKKNSIEGMLSSSGFEYGFFDFETLINRHGGEWLSKQIIMRPTFHKPFKYKWSDVYDGVFFIKTAKPIQKERIIDIFKDIDPKEIEAFLMKYL
jgi:erythromycin esterase